VGTRQASTTLRLRDGETQILAGLINDKDVRNSAGLPILHELPVAGRLFGSRTDSVDKTEIVLLVTPRIVRNLVMPPVAAGLLPSGTEAQPGARPMALSAGSVGMAPGRGGMSTSGGSMSGPAGAASQETGAVISGPEQASVGAMIQLTVRNRSAEPMDTALMVDTSVFEAPAAKGQARVPLSIPPNGTQAVLLRIKPEASGGQQELALEDGSAQWRVKVVGRDAAPAEAAPASEPEPTTPEQEAR
jgi:general secretion pathway protein D